MDYTKLSKQISYILRHHPEEFNITLDSEGWCTIDELIKILNNENKYGIITVTTLNDMLNSFDKKRFEIKNKKIRAYYGHSIETKIIKKTCEPPKYLYHGTARKNIDRIRKQGIITMSRQYVHLSDNTDLAYTVGKRYDNDPIIIKVLAQKAWQNNIKFYCGNEDTWLSENIPFEFLEI